MDGRFCFSLSFFESINQSINQSTKIKINTEANPLEDSSCCVVPSNVVSLRLCRENRCEKDVSCELKILPEASFVEGSS
jgi:hypothetical protein